ncbi:NUDIX hydrolase [Humidisolicoccus flavus]|uniref:NUDIX hydrolase n=1 Tax=Humidisolicoccus flavus TaxID=3111414 RepID=UPI0032523614
MTSKLIVVSAICFERADGAVLTVRKRGTTSFMLPGGKPEEGESAAKCAIREVYEELGLIITLDELHLLGTWDAPAANEHGHTVRATVFTTSTVIRERVQAEIDEARWVQPREAIDDESQAPLNREFIFPLLERERGARGGTGEPR